jgi:hypothetical protein
MVRRTMIINYLVKTRQLLEYYASHVDGNAKDYHGEYNERIFNKWSAKFIDDTIRISTDQS